MESAGRSPLEELKAAFTSDDADGVRLMLDRHPDLKALVNEPFAPFDSPAVVNVRSREMLDVLLAAGADLNARSRWWAGGFGLLHQAPVEVAVYAIERGARVDVHAAARLGLKDELEALLARDPGAVHARGGDGQTPLHFASTVEIARMLLERGAEMDALDVDHESTPAQHMLGDRQDVARFLIQQGCATDLMLGAAIGDKNIVRRELDEDPERIRTYVGPEYFPMRDPRAGGTIYQWTLGFYASTHQVARKFGHHDVLRLLDERSPPEVQLLEACSTGDDAAIERLRLKHPAILDELTPRDRRRLAHAARNNDAAAVGRMLQSGLPVDVTGQHEATALHWAAYHGNVEMTRTLLGYDPPLEVTDADFGATPLGWAIHGSEHGWHRETGEYGATVAALLGAGAQRPEKIEGSPAVQDVLRLSG